MIYAFSFIQCALQLNNMPFNANECAENYAKQHERKRARTSFSFCHPHRTCVWSAHKVTLQKMKRLLNRREKRKEIIWRKEKKKNENTPNKSLECIVRLKSELCKQMAATLRKQINDKFLKIFIINHLYGSNFHFN